MSITAQMVRDLREQTGAGMMACKKVLVEVEGDVKKAVDLLRKKGMASADKKSARIAAEGVIVTSINSEKNKALLLELNCETDFVAKGEEFKKFASAVAQVALENSVTEPAELNTLSISGQPVEEGRKALIAKVGENIFLRRATLIETKDGLIGNYQHGDKIGVVVALEGTQNADIGKDIAMHIAACKPFAISESDLSAEVIEREKTIYKAQALESGKPEAIVEKIVAGRIKKYIAEITLLGQNFVKDADQTIQQLLQASGASVKQFYRFEVGEGVEKREDDFNEEVAKMKKQALSNQ